MAQRKKKPSGHQLQAIAKAHYKNEFMRKLKYLINASCGEDIYSLIPTRILEKVYLVRYHSVQIAAAEGHIIPANEITDLKVILAEQLKRTTIDFSPNGIKISLTDFMTVGISLHYIIPLLKEEGIPNMNKVTSALLKYCMNEEPKTNSMVCLYRIIESYGYGMSNIGTRFYWLDFDVTDNEEDKPAFNNRVKIYTEVPKTINVKIDGISRPALRIGWANCMKGMTWLTLKPSLLNISGVPDDQPMAVYMQTHAFRRFSERTEGIYDFMAQQYIYESFLNPKICYDKNHNLLIEYRILNSKAGYFRFDVVGNIIVIRTFLFLTNSGTPEGDLLGKNTGLKMLDKNYLSIDKLSSFMSSDIRKNEQVNKIFTDAGCQSLFELYEKLAVICTKHSNQTTFERMLDYIGINKASITETITAE